VVVVTLLPSFVALLAVTAVAVAVAVAAAVVVVGVLLDGKSSVHQRRPVRRWRPSWIETLGR